MVGSNAARLRGTILKTGAEFRIPKAVAICTNCSLEIASIALTIYIAQKRYTSLMNILNKTKIQFASNYTEHKRNLFERI